MGERTTPAEMVETRVATRSSILDAVKGLGGAAVGFRVDKEELKRRISIPADLAATLRESIKFRDPVVAARKYSDAAAERAAVEPPEAPVVVFVNSRSGGRHGPELMARLQELMGENQVFDLSEVKPSDFVHYGLLCLERLAESGDAIAKITRERLRVMVAGGDGTVGWVLGCLGELYTQNREPVPPTAIIPLGTGNDLSRSFGWGGSFPFAWRSAVKRALLKAATGPVCRLDSWHVTVTMPEGEKLELLHSLRHREQSNFSQEFDINANLPDKISCFEGVFYNYFSIGMDAQVAYGFHHLRDKNPNLARGPISNKIIYSGYSCTQGWFFTPCATDPSLRGLRNILRIFVKKVNCSEWEPITVPKGVRSIVCLNLHNYGSGRNPWGRPKPEYLEKRGFVEAHLDDGLLEGLKQGWHASVVMVELITAKHIAQIEALDGHALLLSGVDLVDGTPVLDVKPYLPYSDSIQEATIPKWLKEENALAVSSICFSEEFNSTLSICWPKNEKKSLYASMEEFQSLIKEVLSWDIRSLSQRSRPHHAIMEGENHGFSFLSLDGGDEPTGIIYHLILEGLTISYRIDDGLNILVERATLVPSSSAVRKDRHNYSMWRGKLVKKMN